MSDPDMAHRPTSSGRAPPMTAEAPRSGDFQESVARLERAVDDLVGTARTRFSDRATAVIDETTSASKGSWAGATTAMGSARGSELRDARLDALPRRLYRDPSREKIVGVCAGIARYYGVEPWVVRCIAVTGLLFFPTIVFPAYWIAYFVMEKPPKAMAAAERVKTPQASSRSQLAGPGTGSAVVAATQPAQRAGRSDRSGAAPAAHGNPCHLGPIRAAA
jgi:phage shock protein PspC (stress-responsive transcriptional regulator)